MYHTYLDVYTLIYKGCMLNVHVHVCMLTNTMNAKFDYTVLLCNIVMKGYTVQLN